MTAEFDSGVAATLAARVLEDNGTKWEQKSSEKAWVMLDFKGERRTVSGVGFKRSKEGFPSVANVLCWDEHNRSWLHAAHVQLVKPASESGVYSTVIPKVRTTAMLFYFLSEGAQKHIEVAQIILYQE